MPALRNVRHEGIGGEARGKPRQYKRKAAAKLPHSIKRKGPDRHRGALFYVNKFTRTVFTLSSKKCITCKPLKRRTLACDERRRRSGEQDEGRTTLSRRPSGAANGNVACFPVQFADEDRVNHSQEKARYTLLVLFAINLLNFYDRYIPGALAEPIRKEWALTDSQLGWLTFAFTALYAVVGVPLGRWADREKRPQILAWGVAAWSLLTAASGIAWNYGSLFAARLGVGVGEAACAPASNSLIGDLYPAAQRARALSFFMLGLPLGGFLSFFVSGYVAARYGWRMAFY